MSNKPIIKAFRWDSKFMALDWNLMRGAFDITRPDGGAGILIPNSNPNKPGVQAAISAHKIRGFLLRPDPETNLTEIILEVSYGTGEKCLGLTDQVAEAERWVADANKLVEEARERRKD